MTDVPTDKRLNIIIWLLAANLAVMVSVGVAMVFGILPKIERAVETSERVEARFQSFADEVQPVVTAGAGKAIETITKIDSDRLSESATDKADTLMDAATEKAKRFLNQDNDATD